MQKEKLFGKLPAIPFCDYQQIWNETELDVDNKQELLIEKMLPSIQQTITKIIQFARTLPGFRQLSCEDQVALIKGTTQSKNQSCSQYLWNHFQAFILCNFVNVKIIETL